MITFLFKKLLHKPWLIGCLLIGSIVSLALIASIPLYSSALLQRSLIREVQTLQDKKNIFPAGLWLKADFTFGVNPEKKDESYSSIDKGLAKAPLEFISSLPVLEKCKDLTLASLDYTLEGKKKEQLNNLVDLSAAYEIEKHIKITNGRIFKVSRDSGDYLEGIVTKEAMENKNIILGKTYEVKRETDKSIKPIKVKITGVFTYKDEKDLYWYGGLERYKNSILLDYDTLTGELSKGLAPLLSHGEWYYAFDYQRLRVDNLGSISDGYKEYKDVLKEYGGILESQFELVNTLDVYKKKEEQTNITLLVLFFPVLIMLFIYVFMISQQLVETEKNEISVLQSRGATSLQIFVTYLLESIIFAGIAFAVSPFLAGLLCRILGSTNGFMEFVNRKNMLFELSTKVLIYSFAGAVLLVITICIPVIPASRTTIVKHKSRISRAGMAIWKKFFLDIIFLAAASYGFYNFLQRQKTLAATGASGTEVSVDPLLYMSTALLIIGAGLLSLRLYPLVLKVIFIVGRRFWTPAAYSTFISVSRTGGKEQFLMLFLIITFATGVFSASSARTINKNIEDKTRYEIGADIVLKSIWDSNEPPLEHGANTGTTDGNPLRYIEPDFTPYTKLGGAASVTKVSKIPNVKASPGGFYKDDVTIMGIDPYSFGSTAWLRKNLLPHGINEYLTLMCDYPSGFLVSKSLMEKYRLKQGDNITVTWDPQEKDLKGTVLEFIDYWPTYNAFKSSKEKTDLIVANLDYINSIMKIQPYDIWIRKNAGVSDAEMDRQLKENKKIGIESISFAGQELAERKRDTALLSVNGSTTASFIISILICFLGFLIYWIMSIKQRFLYFGVLRALGMRQSSITAILVLEQLLITGASAVLGMAIGSLVSEVCVPMLQMSYSSAQQVPPFRVIAYLKDYQKLAMAFVIMLAVGMVILKAIVSRMKIDQAIKLGED